VVSDQDFQPQLRLHPLSWLFTLARHVRQLIVPLGAFVLFGTRNNGEMWGFIVLIPLLIGALWHQWIYRYGFGPRGLVIHDGLFFRNRRQIEYPRIENIDVERGVLHRLLGVAQVSVATSTGGKPEASIRVLSMEAVQELRARIFERTHVRETHTPVAGADEVLLNVTPGELIRYGLIDNRGLWVVVALTGFLAQNGTSAMVSALLQTRLAGFALSRFVALGIAMQIGLVIAGIAAAALALRLLSIGTALITLFDFTLTRHEHDFRIRYGLLTRVALNLRVRRIQSVHQTQTLLHRLFDRVSLRADLAGDSGNEESKHSSRVRTHWLAPVCTPFQAQALMIAALPDANLAEAPDWQPLAPHARARLFRRTVYIGTALVVMIALALKLWPQSPVRPDASWTLLLLPLICVAWLYAHIYVKNTRWALTSEAILFQHGWLTRRLIIAPRNRLQSVKLSISPFDRHYGMANVHWTLPAPVACATTFAFTCCPRRLHDSWPPRWRLSCSSRKKLNAASVPPNLRLWTAKSSAQS